MESFAWPFFLVFALFPYFSYSWNQWDYEVQWAPQVLSPIDNQWELKESQIVLKETLWTDLWGRQNPPQPYATPVPQAPTPQLNKTTIPSKNCTDPTLCNPKHPTMSPILNPAMPLYEATAEPTEFPTRKPTDFPSAAPSVEPTLTTPMPSPHPTFSPTIVTSNQTTYGAPRPRRGHSLVLAELNWGNLHGTYVIMFGGRDNDNSTVHVPTTYAVTEVGLRARVTVTRPP